MKKIILLFILLFPLFLSSCGKEEIAIQKHYKTAEVSSGSIIESEYFVSYTESFQSVPLAPKVGGRIVSIHKKIGDTVQKGDLLAVLDGTESKTAYASTSGIIGSLQELKNSTALAYDKQIEATKEQIKQLETGKEIADISISGANTGLEDTKNITKNQIETVKSQMAQAELGVETAELQLKNAQENFDQKEKDMYTNSKNALSQAEILGNNALSFLDELFGISAVNQDKNDRYDRFLGIHDSMAKNEVEIQIRNALTNFEELKKKNVGLEGKQEILVQLKENYAFFNGDVKKMLSLAYTVVDGSEPSIGSLSEQEIQAFKQAITAFQQKNEQLILTVEGNYFLGLKGSIDNIEGFEKEKKSSLDMLEKQVENAKKQIAVLENTLAMYEAQASGKVSEVATGVQKAEKQKQMVGQQMSEAQAGIEALKQKKQASLAEIDAKIAEAKANQNSAGVMIENGKIYANISGVVVQKMAEEGQVIGGGMPILMLSDSTDIKVVVSVPESVSATLKNGQKVELKVDGVETLLSGEISNIFPSKDMLTKRVGVEIRVMPGDKKVMLGSYTKVFFTEENPEDSEKNLIIPNSAIISQFMIPGVYVLENGVAIFQKIEILKQNDDFSQVKGLEIGQTLITAGKENIFDGERLEK